jgi:hypothetical protein
MKAKRVFSLLFAMAGLSLLFLSGQVRYQRPAEASDSVNSASSALASTWSRLYLVDKNRYNYVRAMVQAFDGDFLVSGESGSGTTLQPWLMKLSETGSVRWARSVSAIILSLAKTSDGKYVALGSAGSGTTTDLLVFKFDENGAVDWAYTYGGPMAETPGMIRPSDDGGFLVTAASNSFAASSGFDLWVLKLSSAGTVKLQRAIGGAVNEGAGFIIETGDGGFFVATDTSSFSEGINDSWFLKFDSSGAVEWQKSIGSKYTENPSGAVITPEGEYLITAFTNSVTDTADAHLFKLSAGGKLIWQKLYGGNWGEATNAIFPAADGNYIVVGNQSSWPLTVGASWAFKITPAGGILWQRAYTGRGTNKCLRATNGDLIIAEPFGTSDQYAIRDALIYRISPEGDLASACNETWTTSCVPVDTNFVLRDTSATPISTNATVASTSVTFSATLPMLARDPCQTYVESPEAPLNLALARTVSRGVFRGEAVHKLTWQAASGNPRASTPTNYRIYRKMAGQGDASYQRIGTVAGTILTYSDGVQSLTDRYVYAVAAVTSDGIESPMSASVGN